MATDLIPATVVLGRKSVVVYLNVEEDAASLSKMLQTGGRVSIERIFAAPAVGGAHESPEETPKPRKPRNGQATATAATPASRKAPAAATGGVCRGTPVLPDIEHGPPGRGQAHGFCATCVKQIPRATRLEMYTKAKGGKTEAQMEEENEAE